MSFIRWSSKVKGQKNTSRIYAWGDIAGGIQIHGRRNPDDNDGYVILSYPEMYHLCKNFVDRIESIAKRQGVSPLKIIKQRHKGFFKTYDKQYEKAAKKRMKEFKDLLNQTSGRKEDN